MLTPVGVWMSGSGEPIGSAMAHRSRVGRRSGIATGIVRRDEKRGKKPTSAVEFVCPSSPGRVPPTIGSAGRGPPWLNGPLSPSWIVAPNPDAWTCRRSGMRISPVRLPRLLGVLVIAFAQYEARPLLGAVKLFRGIAIQLAYRWATGKVLADPHDSAVLLWSERFRGKGRRPLARELYGVLAATSIGLALVIVSSSILLVPVALVLEDVGVDARAIIGVGLTVVAVLWLMTCWGAFRSYQNELALTALLPEPSGLRWRIDFLAAIPARSGHGGRLLDAFLGHADECGAEVVLHCDRRNLTFYRHHGFHQPADGKLGGQRVVLRKARSIRPGRRDRPYPHPRVHDEPIKPHSTLRRSRRVRISEERSHGL